MDAGRNAIDAVVKKFNSEVIEYIRAWMKSNQAEDIEYHRYRMKLFSSLYEANSTSEKLVMLLDRVRSRCAFEILEAISDGAMGDSMAKYIFSSLMIAVNEEYRKNVEHELDRVKAETNVLLQRAAELKKRIGHH